MLRKILPPKHLSQASFDRQLPLVRSPFYVRTGKRLTEKGTRINIVFKQVPVNVFKKDVTDCESKKKLAPNVLTIYIQPTEGFSLSKWQRNRSRIRHPSC